MNNFNKIYEEHLGILNEINAGIASSRKIIEIKNLLISGWERLLFIAKDYENYYKKIMIDKNDKLKLSDNFIKFENIYNKYPKDIGFGQIITIIINGKKLLIQPTIQLSQNTNNKVFEYASTAKSDNFLKDNLVQCCLYIRGNSFFDEIENSKNDLIPFGIHEASHIFDIGIDRIKGLRTNKKYLNAIDNKLNYNKFSDKDKEYNDKNYLMDLEIIAYTGSAVEEVLLQRKKDLNISFGEALKLSPSWNEIIKVCKQDTKEYNKIKNKLLFAWNNYEEFI